MNYTSLLDSFLQSEGIVLLAEQPRLPENHFNPMMNESFWGARIIGYPALPVAGMHMLQAVLRDRKMGICLQMIRGYLVS